MLGSKSHTSTGLNNVNDFFRCRIRRIPDVHVFKACALRSVGPRCLYTALDHKTVFLEMSPIYEQYSAIDEHARP